MVEKVKGYVYRYQAICYNCIKFHKIDSLSSFSSGGSASSVRIRATGWIQMKKSCRDRATELLPFLYQGLQRSHRPKSFLRAVRAVPRVSYNLDSLKQDKEGRKRKLSPLPQGSKSKSTNIKKKSESKYQNQKGGEGSQNK